MVGTTYLERPVPAVYLDSRPTEGKVRSKKIEWKPMKISAINRNLDSRPMVGTTYLQRPAPAVYLESRPMEGKVRSKKLEWEPVIIPPDSYTLDSRPMVGTTYLECPAPAVYLDSWLIKGASYPQPHDDWEVTRTTIRCRERLPIYRIVREECRGMVHTNVYYLSQRTQIVLSREVRHRKPDRDGPRMTCAQIRLNTGGHLTTETVRD